MSQLKFSLPAGIFQLPDGAIAAGVDVTDDLLIPLSYLAKAAASRTEFFNMGYYAPGDSVPTPVSPVDGYSYKVEECIFLGIEASGDSPQPGAIAGQAALPVPGIGLPGPLIVTPFRFQIDPLSGGIRMEQYAQNGAADYGIAQVWCIGQRAAVHPSLTPSSAIFAQPVSDPGGFGGNPGEQTLPRYGPGFSWGY